MKKVVSIFLALALALSLAICGIAAAEDHAQDAAALTEQAKANLDAEDYETAFPILRAAADLGDAKAQYYLGFLYDMGKGVEQDYEEAVKYYRLAADQGDAAAQCNLGFCYYDGRGVAQDYDMARKYYHLAADQGDEVALYNLGSNCFFGTGMEQDYGEAYRYFCLSAEGGYPAGIFAVGECYYLGTGVEKDLEAAAEWYRKALDAGFAPRDEEEAEHIRELIPGWDAESAIDYSKAILGTWEGHSTSEITVNDDGRDHRWEYREDGTFLYYNKEGDEWVPADDEVSAYTLEGSLLTTTWAESDQEITESWEITIDGDTMTWTAQREDGNGNTFTVSFELTRVKA